MKLSIKQLRKIIKETIEDTWAGMTYDEAVQSYVDEGYDEEEARELADEHFAMKNLGGRAPGTTDTRRQPSRRVRDWALDK